MKIVALFICGSLSWRVAEAASKGLWASTSASFGSLTQEAYFLGNGRLGAMPFGQPGAGKVVLNVDSLWSGGPFESTSYRGGNPASPVSQYLPGIREWIFQNGTGKLTMAEDVTEILGDTSHYGSYQVYGNLSVALTGVNSATTYNRSLDLSSGIHTTTYTANDGATYTETNCSYPDQVCVFALSSTAALPEVTIALENQLTDSSLVNATCGENYVRLTGITQLGPPLGMKYDGIAHLTTRTGTAYCSDLTAGTLVIPAGSHIRSFSLVFGGNTDYDQKAGTAETNYSFKGVDPGPYVESVTAAASAKPESSDNAQWANNPATPAWMMQHVLDHFDYSQNVTWLQQQAYPLLKGVAQFWLTQLQEDEFYDDNSLVVNPCNSPEHGPTTFGCTHFQQLIHQLFSDLVSLSSVLPISDDFGSNLTNSLASLDKGVHTGTWGEIKEWKVPDSFGYDFENDTHRHLSHLVGWYPGHSFSSLLSGYTNETIQNAVATSLYSRGPGNADDANSGWEKVWRSSCWALLNNTQEAYFELGYAIEQNFAGNLASMYNGHSSPFQIDANFGFVGAVLSMLVVDLPTLGTENGEKRTVVLGPAIPAAWGGGSVKGLRVRGGGIVDFKWDGNGVVTSASLINRESPLLIINRNGQVLVDV
ncbi:glycosyl hydrolase family 65, N-terminal domain-containing protein [Xylogone sp. PMI_703]|nr:glycosyl hydrolase family 65, N-terminal domain-containing protein [Xylogone sp. PMI_703]